MAPRSESLANWHHHFDTVGHVPAASFGEEYFEAVCARFDTIPPRLFSAPLSVPELRRALSTCVDLAVVTVGSPYSVFRTDRPWCQSAHTSLFSLAFVWRVLPTLWQRSILVPVFKRCDSTATTNQRPIVSLASCCFEVLEHLVWNRIGPHFARQLEENQGGL